MYVLLGIAILKKTNQIATWTDQYFRGVDIIFQRPQNITYLISNTHVFHLDNSDTFLPIMNIFTQHTLTIKAAGIYLLQRIFFFLTEFFFFLKIFQDFIQKDWLCVSVCVYVCVCVCFERWAGTMLKDFFPYLHDLMLLCI